MFMETDLDCLLDIHSLCKVFLFNALTFISHFRKNNI